MFRSIILILLNVLAFKANAFYISTYKSNNKIDFNRPTRIIIAAKGGDLSTQFQEVASTKALKYSELYPGQQIVLISANEKEVEEKSFLLNLGFSIQSENRSTFNGSTFIDETIKFSQIASIDIFSHSSAQYGIHLDGFAHRLTLNTKGIEKLKGHFIKDAYAFLHGCNGGFNLAPFLSTSWEIPVAGAMTSSNFQKLHSDGQYYLTEEGFYPNSDWAKNNSKSFNQPVSCAGGNCIRLKPDNNPYTGLWGEYGDGGLSFYKFFCMKNSTEECTRIMAKSLLSFIGIVNLKVNSSLSEYKNALYDFLCPISAKHELRSECISNLDNALLTGDETYNPFSHTQIECDFKSCLVEIQCKKAIPLTGIIKPGSCKLINKFEGKSTTLVREFKAYLAGFKTLAN